MTIREAMGLAVKEGFVKAEDWRSSCRLTLYTNGWRVDMDAHEWCYRFEFGFCCLTFEFEEEVKVKKRRLYDEVRMSVFGKGGKRIEFSKEAEPLN